MDGAIVTNGFLRTEKLEEPVRMMMSSAERMGIGLRAFTNSDLAVPIGDREALEEVIGEPDFIVFWDKDVRCAANLELCGFRVLNTSECIRICDDKSLTHLILSKDGVPSIPSTVVPMTFDGIGYGDMGFVDVLEGSHGYPMVVKDCFGSFGMQVPHQGQKLPVLYSG